MDWFKGLRCILDLLIGLLITLGIGSSFSTIPILAIIYVPLCIQFGFSQRQPLRLLVRLRHSVMGSPASGLTLGPTSGFGGGWSA